MHRDKTTNNKATNYGWGFLVCMKECDKRIKQLKEKKRSTKTIETINDTQRKKKKKRWKDEDEADHVKRAASPLVAVRLLLDEDSSEATMTTRVLS